jgi:guanylate kinase
MSKASDEMSHWAEYDYVIVNKKLSLAFSELRAILIGERLKRERQPGLSSFVRKLQSQLHRR